MSPPLNLYPIRQAVDPGPEPDRRPDSLTWEQCIARYPRITRALTYAGFCPTEAACAIRDYRAGSLWSGEAINYTGGTRRAITSATTDYHRHIAQRYSDPESHTNRLIRRYQAEYTTRGARTR